MSIFKNFPVLKPQASGGGGGGDVVGPVSSTNNAIVRFDGTTGELIQDSNVTIDANNNVVVNQSAIATGTPTMFTLVAGAHTNLTASTDIQDVHINLGATAQFATGAKTLQRSVIVTPRTYSAVAATTISSAATWHFVGAPVAGTNVTITNSAVVHITTSSAITPAGTGDLFVTGSGSTRPFAVFRTAGASAHLFTGFVYEMDVSNQMSLITRFIRTNSGTVGLSLGRGRNTAGTVGNDTFSPSTTVNVSGVTVVSTFSPTANAPRFAGLEVNPTFNGTSTGVATALVASPIVTALTGGTMNIVDFGTTTTDYHTGFTSRFRINSAGDTIMGGALEENKVADVASATTITVAGGNSVDITGTTTINGLVTTSWQIGSKLLLQFDAALTVTHNSGAPGANAVAFLLAGSVNLTTAAGTRLWVWYNGTNWMEIARTVA